MICCKHCGARNFEAEAALASPSPRPAPPARDERAEALAADHALAPVAVEAMIRAEALREAARLVEGYRLPGNPAVALLDDLAARLRALASIPPASPPTDHAKETDRE